MAKAKVLVVEDEIVVARDIQNILESLEYEVPAIAISGEEAIGKADELKPDLVLMDIVLQGEMDGIEAADQIRDRFNIPIVYLTAYAEDKTIERAKVTEPFGYLLKPFEEREVHTTIEIALYKHKLEKALRESEERFHTFFENLPAGALMIDPAGNVLAASKVFRRLLDRAQDELVGRHFADFTHPEDRNKSQNLYNFLIRGEDEHYSVDRRFLRKDGDVVWTRLHASAIRNESGGLRYATVIVEDLTEFKQAEEMLLVEKMALNKQLAECKKIVGRIAQKRAKEE